MDADVGPLGGSPEEEELDEDDPLRAALEAAARRRHEAEGAGPQGGAEQLGASPWLGHAGDGSAVAGGPAAEDAGDDGPGLLPRSRLLAGADPLALLAEMLPDLISPQEVRGAGGGVARVDSRSGLAHAGALLMPPGSVPLRAGYAAPRRARQGLRAPALARAAGPRRATPARR
jgi:hypothetical protein